VVLTNSLLLKSIKNQKLEGIKTTINGKRNKD